MSKCVIFGSREFSDYKALEKAVKQSGFEITEIFKKEGRNRLPVAVSKAVQQRTKKWL